MFECEKIGFPSADGKHTAAGYIYSDPAVPLRGVIQLSHGMAEYVQRYRPMAEYYAARGYVLAGNDHLGHGETVTPQEYGAFAPHKGQFYVLRDLHAMNSLLHKRFPGLPVILYGHSMGSFFARWYAEVYPESIAGLVLSGTAGPSVRNRMGLVLAGKIDKAKGWQHVSPLLCRLQSSGYCKKIAAPASPNAWLSCDNGAVEAYDADPACGFPFAASAYRDILWVLDHVSGARWANSLPKTLPVLLIAGDADPVGGYGEGVRRVWAMVGDAGVEDLTCQIWEDGRHEMHNEVNREEVFDYVLGWLDDRFAAAE